ncbi:hypothetical protein ACFVT5_41965 [Streptomyces sp. NPDC058001]|uniref:hypothetical protein n=1 Tax=Streptomyces sp. NPDC058001 TaxID=3346300 RepID=UPI0036EA661A
MAAFPAEGGDGGEGGGEVAADAGEVGQAAAGARGEPPVGVGDLAVVVECCVGAAEVLVGFGPVVQGEFGEFTGEQAGFQDGGEAFGGAFAVFVLAAGDGGEEFGQGVVGRVRSRGRVAPAVQMRRRSSPTGSPGAYRTRCGWPCRSKARWAG